MTGQPQNPFANLPMSGQPQFGGQGGGGSTASASGERRVVNRFTPLEFSGTGMQLFGIQLVNILLIAITLGIWIPWARVRKRRFFYNNTRILDEGLDYLATGFDIFKGWLIVTVILVLFYALPMLGIPFLQGGFSLLLVFVYPWALNQSLRFNARNLAWRDVRFDFKGSYLGAFWNFFIFPLIGILSLGLLIPMASRSMRDYIASNYSFGNARFFSESTLGAYYGAGYKTFLLFLVLAIPIIAIGILPLLGPILALRDGAAVKDAVGALDEASLAMLQYGLPVLLFILFAITGSYYRALTRNIMVGSLRLQSGIRFRSLVSGFVLAWIILSNLFLTIISLGLLHPWAQVRQYRYLTENTEIRPISDLKGFIDRQLRAGHSVGDAIGEAGGVEISF